MKDGIELVPIEELPELENRLAHGLDVPLVVTVGGNRVAVLVSAEAFQRLLSEREMLRRLALGDLEFAGSEGHPLDEVLEDCDLLLEES